MDLLERDGEVVSRHPWELARSKFFVRLLRRLAPASRDVRLLDVGAGDAWFSAQLVETLPAGSRITCWDVNYSDEDLSVYARDSSSLTLTAEQPDDPFGGILMLDVVEHVEDDIGFVSRIVESRLERDGWVLVSVPAYQSLFTSHDNAVKHFRRYSPCQAAEVLEAAGLRVEAQGGLFHSLLVVRGTQAAKERLAGPKDPWVGPAHGVVAPDSLGRWFRLWGQNPECRRSSAPKQNRCSQVSVTGPSADGRSLSDHRR